MAKNFLPIPPKFIIHNYPSLHLDDWGIVVRFLLEEEDAFFSHGSGPAVEHDQVVVWNNFLGGVGPRSWSWPLPPHAKNEWSYTFHPEYILTKCILYYHNRYCICVMRKWRFHVTRHSRQTLKPIGYFTYRPVQHWKSLQGVHIPFVCFVGI